MSIREKFNELFETYIDEKEKRNLSYVITSGDRQGNVNSNPHALHDHAIDLTLRVKKDYAPIREYNELLAYMLDNWPYRAGLDNTPYQTEEGKPGNVHLHVDLGHNRPQGQTLPFFFIEDNGVFQKQVFSTDDI